MARYSIRSVSLSPPHFKWATTRMRLRASLHCVFSTLMCFLNDRCESHHSPRNFVDSSTGRSVLPILIMGGLWARDRGALKCTTLHLWAANLKPFLVAHSCMAFTACCRCLSMVSRERPRKQIARSSTKSALKMSLAIQEGSSTVFPILTMGGLWTRHRGAVKCMTLHLWAANLKPFLVAHSCMAFTAWCRCLYGVQRASSKTDRQVIDKECFEDVLGNTRGQLINLQSKTCHSQDTASWNTSLRVKFFRKCCPNSDSNSPVPEILWHKNRQCTSEANPVVSDDAILPGCLIGFLQVKEETNCMLPLSKGIPEISFEAHQVVGRATMFSETTLASV